MSSVDLQFSVSSCKCFIVEKTFSAYALLQRIENKKEMNLCTQIEQYGPDTGRRNTDRTIVKIDPYTAVF